MTETVSPSRQDAKLPMFMRSVILLVVLTLGALVFYHIFNAPADSNLNVLSRWIPFIMHGFALNVLMSVIAMFLATIFGVMLGFMQISDFAVIRYPARFVTHVFRNSPWLVILFAIMLLVPFEVRLPYYGTVMLPGWVKATVGFTLPVMANISEVLRGAVASIPTGQWESAESLAFSRIQTMRYIILPQCVRRMLPPWMNWFALLTLMTPIAAILGVNEALGNTQAAMESAGSSPDLLIPFYIFLMSIFFVFIYPISVFTKRLECRFATT